MKTVGFICGDGMFDEDVDVSVMAAAVLFSCGDYGVALMLSVEQ